MRITAHVSKSIRAALAAGAMLATATTLPARAESTPSLQRAYEAILAYQEAVNAKDELGHYLAQSEGPTAFAERLAPYVADSFIGVSGMGLGTEVFGYQPSMLSRRDLAAGMIALQALGSYADWLAGGEGLWDVEHQPYRGSVSGKTAYIVFNFRALGSQMDEQGNRLPVEIPNWLLDPNATGSSLSVGRCICTCELVDGEWKFTSFFFVLTPEDLLFDTGQSAF